jgi:hypothetical protein
VTKFYYLELLCALEGTLSCWSRLHLQSLASTPVSRRVDVRQAAGRKKVAESLSQHDEKHVPTPLSGIRVRKIDLFYYLFSSLYLLSAAGARLPYLFPLSFVLYIDLFYILWLFNYSKKLTDILSSIYIKISVKKVF